MKIKSLFLAVGILLSANAVSHAQTADEIINSYLDAIGGVEHWKNFNSMRVTGNAIQMGVNYPFTVISMRPNLQKVVADVMGKQFIEAYDGESAWGLNPFTGATEPQKKTEEESKESAMQHFESDFINYKDKGYTVTLEGTEEIEGAKCYNLKLVKEEGREEYHFIDAENYVPIMTRSFIPTGEMKGQAVETYFSDYQEVEGTGVVVAFTMEQRFNGQVVMQMVTEKVEFNPEDLTKESFAFPEK